MTRIGRFLVAGTATGRALALTEPLSFWGGVEARTGEITDRSHPQLGAVVTGRVLVMPGARGSSSASSVLAETIRLGTGPAAIILGRADPILAVGSIVARTLYGLACPVLVCAVEGIETGDIVEIGEAADGSAAVRVAAPA